jgi:pimeloyl-ACP methyl ester carboxylesterase
VDLTVTERSVDAGDVRLNVATAGDGPPVLLLHGFPDSWRLWRHQIAALAGAGHRVIAPDLRGFGGSDRPADVDAYRMGRLVDDVAAVCAGVGVERAAVVGHDWGAGLAWQVAFRRPELVDRLAVLSVGHHGAAYGAGLEQRRLSWYMLWFLFPGVAEAALPRHDWRFYRQFAWGGAEPGQQEDCDRQIAELSRPGALTAGLNWYRANIHPAGYVPDAPADGPRVGCPTLGVWSTGDPFLGEAQMVGSAAFVDGPWRYERVEGGHWIPTAAPDQLNALLLDFLAPDGG